MEKVGRPASNVWSRWHSYCYIIFVQLSAAIVADPDITAAAKAFISEKLAICDKRLVDGADEEAQVISHELHSLDIFHE
jgi:hypothetical protein